MGASSHTALHSCGQGNFDTIVTDTTNNGQPFEVASPLNGVMPYVPAYIYHTTPTTPPKNTPPRIAMSVGTSFTASHLSSRLTGTGGGTAPSAPLGYYFKFGASNSSLAQGQSLISWPVGAAFPSQPTGLVYSDTQNHDWIPAGDLACFTIGWTVAMTGSICAAAVQWQADYVSGIAQQLSAGCNRQNTAYIPLNIYSATRQWISVVGEISLNATPGPAQTVIPTSGTWSKLTFLLDSAGGTDAYTRSFRSFFSNSYIAADPGQGAMPYGQQIVSFSGVTAAMASVPEADTQNHDWVPAGDLIGIEYEGQNASAQYAWYFGVSSQFAPANPNTSILGQGGETEAGPTTTKSFQQVSNGGQPRISTTSQESLSMATCSGTFSGMNIVCGAAGTGATSTFYINNAADTGTSYGSQTFSPALGAVQDTQNHDWVPAGDAFANTVTGFGSSYTMNTQSVAFTTLGPHPDNMLLFGVG